mgnify:CR=1 FL=1
MLQLSCKTKGTCCSALTDHGIRLACSRASLLGRAEEDPDRVATAGKTPADGGKNAPLQDLELAASPRLQRDGIPLPILLVKRAPWKDYTLTSLRLAALDVLSTISRNAKRAQLQSSTGSSQG